MLQSFQTIVNACIELLIKVSGIKFLTKDAHDHLVGHHGEGLKPAPSVLSHDGYQMSIAASGCN
jgi:hypothetical protein